MKSLIKPLLVAALAAALCKLLMSLVVPYALMLLIPDSWSGSWMFESNLLVSGFITGLVVVRVLPAQRYSVIPMLILIFALLVIGGYALNRCSGAQVAAIDQLANQTWTDIGNPDAVAPPQVAVDLSAAPGVTQEGQGFSYSCVRPGETLDYFLSLHMMYGVSLLGLLLALLLSHRSRRPRQG
ncbi:hypothetical protein [Pseudomonas sp. CF161]|uniref:hypothetical protein n=1 Tax=Pseudomonas sp. CF161 TaxID=911241 RepID=UPI00035513BC|nr:hypothetical protein [Pseudomonas sp. CF161]EPL03763.1 hypothetical protein CF161_30363 [Pseudomonas sp. CF161]